MAKITKKVALKSAIATLTNTEYETNFSTEEVVNKLNEMLEQLDKNVKGEKPMTEHQKQNEDVKNNVLILLSDGKARTATEIMKETLNIPKDMTNQRISALLRLLILDKKVEKESTKGKTYFRIVR